MTENAIAVQKLLVEGDSDKGFFGQVCQSLNLNPQIVVTPKDCQGRKNSKQDVFKQIEILIKDFDDGKLERLAIIIDADYRQVNSIDGYENTVKSVEDIVKKAGFYLKNKNLNKIGGLIFEHDDGFKDLGLWIMPNNQDEGMLEDFIKCCVANGEQLLFSHAIKIVSELDKPKFKHRRTKAEVATWLAWQKVPGHGLYSTMTHSLIDETNPLFQELNNWLKHIFS